MLPLLLGTDATRGKAVAVSRSFHACICPMLPLLLGTDATRGKAVSRSFHACIWCENLIAASGNLFHYLALHALNSSLHCLQMHMISQKATLVSLPI